MLQDVEEASGRPSVNMFHDTCPKAAGLLSRSIYLFLGSQGSHPVKTKRKNRWDPTGGKGIVMFATLLA